MPTLRDKESNRLIGRISDTDLKFLIDQLEEESDSDTDYWIDENTLVYLEQEGASTELVTMLRSAIQGRDGFDVAWTQD